MQLKISHIEENMSKLANVINALPELTKSIHELALVVAELRKEMAGDKSLNTVEIKALHEDMADIKVQVNAQWKKIDDNRSDIDKAKGAAGMANILWGIAWTIGTTAVGVTVWVVTH